MDNNSSNLPPIPGINVYRGDNNAKAISKSKSSQGLRDQDFLSDND